ncbi:hypothetical protein HAX54_009615 [Datura stramonium]|uniref:Uncharacterized protein n=1 Tax=Datura stramonium TaxID=4076 RepID=A0ABS8TF34_DATST|nr:hypothetical protein [Datura stramonium]
MATEANTNSSTLVLLPRSSVPKVLWMADIRSTSLPNWNLGVQFFPKQWRGILRLHEHEIHRRREAKPMQNPKIKNQWLASILEEVLDRHDVLKRLQIAFSKHFNQPVSLKGLKAAGAKLGQDILKYNQTEIVAVNPETGRKSHQSGKTCMPSFLF